jgi:hypothetical protein
MTVAAMTGAAMTGAAMTVERQLRRLIKDCPELSRLENAAAANRAA